MINNIYLKFVFKSMFLRKNSRIKNKPLIDHTPSRSSTLVQPPSINFKKLDPLQFRGKYRKRSIVLYPEFIAHIYCYMYLLCARVEVQDNNYGWGSL